MGWIGVDLDGTLAHYEGYVAADVIGEPVPLMLSRVKAWLKEGIEVKIFTARADVPVSVEAIKKWCVQHIGQELPITNIKDLKMWQLWDDRCVQVEPNTGRRIDGIVDGHVDPLHPYGRCTCAGEGKCEWCRETEKREAGDGNEDRS